MRTTADPDRFLPYPEIVEARGHEKPYDIHDTNDSSLPVDGMVVIRDRQFYTPLTRRGRPVTRHELAHVRWSPMRLPKVDFDRRILMAVEDARINSALERVGLPVRLSVGDLGQVQHLIESDLERGDVVMFVLRAIASIGTGATEETFAAAESHAVAEGLARRLVDRVRDRLEASRLRRENKIVATVAAGVRAAEEVAAALRAWGLRVDADAAPWMDCCFSHSDGAAAVDPRRRGRGRLRRGGEVGPGRLKIVEAPLTVPRPPCAAGAASGYRAAHEGSVMRYPSRWAVDKAIFRRRSKRRQAGGSVLIDTSGSMSLSVDDVDAILDATKASGLIAIYSGSCDRGELRVVARGGARATATHLAPYGGGNVVDLPALEWLARQPAPRVWVSDGRVTGVGDCVSSDLSTRCKALCRRHGVTRVGTAEEAANVLRG